MSVATFAAAARQAASGLAQPAALKRLHRNRTEVYALEATHVDGPELRCGSRPAKGKDAAGRTEVVFRSSSVPLIEGCIAEWGQDAEVLVVDAMEKRTTLSTKRAVTRPHMVEIQIDLEPDAPTMAAAAIRLHRATQQSVDRNAHRRRLQAKG